MSSAVKIMNERSDFSKWKSLEEGTLTRENLFALFRGEFPAIRMKGFASEVESKSLLSAIDEVGFHYYLNPPVGKIGVSQYERTNSKDQYFSESILHHDKLELIFGKSFNPIKRFFGLLSDLGVPSIEIANEENNRYASLVFRKSRTGILLHVDHSKIDAPDWKISECIAQLGCNLYLTTHQSDGECVIYDKQWAPEDEAIKAPGSYSYDRRYMAGVRKVAVNPVCGDLVLINSKNFHEVNASAEDRINASFFIGLLPNGKLICWT